MKTPRKGAQRGGQARRSPDAAQPPTAERSEASRQARQPQQECERLMQAVLPLAQQSLEERRGFYPFGATLSPRGGVALLDAWMGAEHPPADDALAALEETFRDGAAKRRIKATALVVDVHLVPPGTSDRRDAIEVRLDHRDGYSVRIVFPYSFPGGIGASAVVLDEPFAMQGERRIFPS